MPVVFGDAGTTGFFRQKNFTSNENMLKYPRLSKDRVSWGIGAVGSALQWH